MNFTYPKPPLVTIDGVPAFSAGEWIGHKSNKFERVRKCIRAVDKEDVLHGCDFFNQNPRKRHFTISPSKEIEFKPVMKVFKEAYMTSKDISDEPEIWPQKRKEHEINLEAKRHYYQYRDSYINKLNEKARRSENKIYVKDELNYLSKIGYMQDKKEIANHIEQTKTDETYEKALKDKYSPENITETIGNLVNPIHQTPESIQSLLEKNKHIDPLFLVPQIQTKPIVKKKQTDLNKHDYLTQKREHAIQLMKMRMELIRKDIEYVRDLDSWDTKFLG